MASLQTTYNGDWINTLIKQICSLLKGVELLLSIKIKKNIQK